MKKKKMKTKEIRIDSIKNLQNIKKVNKSFIATHIQFSVFFFIKRSTNKHN